MQHEAALTEMVPLATATSSPSPSHASRSIAPKDAAAKQETDLPKAYLSYLDSLQGAWGDLPDLTITYEHLRYEVPAAATTASGVPNLLSASLASLNRYNPLRGSGDSASFHPLHDCSGVVAPGELTIVLAPPGHGKSALLKSLAGRLTRDASCFKGEVRWNGQTHEQCTATGQQLAKLCAFVEQGDVHFPMLTVRETFQFALDNSNADSALLGTPEFCAMQAKKVELMLELLGLKECADTVVGDTFLRGVSGGQKKRVTLGEMMLGQARALFLDEISTGLDASATFDIVSALKKWTRVMRGSAMVALLQPAPEVFNMFDKVILMRHGHMLFNGTQAQLRAHLAACGIVPNPAKDFADWIVEFLTNPSMVWKRDVQQRGQQSAMNSFRESFKEEQKAQGHDTPPAVAAPLAVPAVGVGMLPRDPSAVKFHFDPEDQGNESDIADIAEEPSPTSINASGSPSLEMSPSPDPSPRADQLQDLGVGVTLEPRKKKLGSIVSSKHVPLSTAALLKRFRASQVYRDTLIEISIRKEALHERAIEDAKLAPSDFTRAQFFNQQSRSLYHHTQTCLWRQWQFMVRSTTFVGPRLFQALFMGLVAGSLFGGIGTGLQDFSPRLGLIVFSMIFISLINLSEIPLASQFKLVIYKQVDAGFYSTFSYVLSVVICHLPLAFLEVFIYSTCVYWLAGFHYDVQSWLFFVSMLFSLNLYVSVTFRSVAYGLRNADVATNIAGPLTIITALFAGFLITQHKIPKWLIWVYWISPYSWGLRSAALNEFHSGRYPHPDDASNTNGQGDIYLDAMQLSKDDSFHAGGIIYLVGVFVLFIFINGYLLASRRSWLTTGTRRAHDETEHPDHATEFKVRVGERASFAPGASGAPAGQGESDQLTSSDNQTGLEFTPMDLTFSDLSYVVTVTEIDGATGKKRTYDRSLLTKINGFARAGELTALMGSSGAGKTTLMDVIAGRKTMGTITGSIKVGGHPQTFPAFARLTGYCEQSDIHVGLMCVREAIEFSAALRLPSTVTAEVRSRFVDQILEDLEMTPLAGRQIGDEINSGLSPGELKRVTIGVELAANPTFLFLDEPTSGLDSRAALIVLRVIKTIARRGRAVVCTIHQPSSEIFGMFDRLLLLKSGGKEVYFGPVGAEGVAVADYFMRAPIEDKFYKPQLPEEINVASWMLDVIGAGTSAKGLIAEYAGIYKESPLREQNMETLALLEQPRAGTKPPAFDTVFASSLRTQYYYVLRRLFTIYWRDTQYAFAKFGILLFMSIVFGLVYAGIDDSDEAGMVSKIGCVYVAVGFVSVMHVSYTMPFVLRMRAVFYREKASSAYASHVYSTSLGLVEIPYLAALTLTFTLPMYFMIGFERSAGAFFQFNLVLFLIGMYFSFLGQLFSSLSPNMQVSDIFAAMCLDLIHLFGGVLIQKASIPIGWAWMYHANSMCKGIIMILVQQYRCEPGIGPDEICPTVFSVQQGNKLVTKWEFITTFLSTGEGWQWYYVGWLIFMIVIVRILIGLTIQFISHIRR